MHDNRMRAAATLHGTGEYASAGISIGSPHKLFDFICFTTTGSTHPATFCFIDFEVSSTEAQQLRCISERESQMTVHRATEEVVELKLNLDTML